MTHSGRPRIDHKTARYQYPASVQEPGTERLAARSTKAKVLGRFRLRVATEALMPGIFGTLRLRCGPENVSLERIQKGVAAFVADHDSTKILGKVESMETANSELYAIVSVFDFPRSREIVEEIRSGARAGISPGMIPIKTRKDPDGKGSYPFVFEVWQPYEVSSTAIPRNADARVIQELPRR